MGLQQQYNTKIKALENELKATVKQREQAISKEGSDHKGEKNKMANNYKTKILELESKLKEFKKKEKAQYHLTKTVQTQQSKITNLDEEIKKMKNQKVNLSKKIREEAEKFEKFRQVRMKEIMEIKKKNLQKDNQISKLQNENKRKELILKKKAEELQNRKKSQDLIRKIILTQKSLKNKKKRSFIKNLQRNVLDSKGNLILDDKMSEEEAENLVDYCTQKIIDNIETEYRIQKEEEELEKLEKELEIERTNYSSTFLKKEKFEIEIREQMLNFEKENEYLIEIQELDLVINDMNLRIDNLEENIEFHRGRLEKLMNELKKNPLSKLESLLIKSEKIKSIENYQLILSIMVQKFISMAMDHLKSFDENEKKTIENKELCKIIENFEKNLKFNEQNYESELIKLKNEYENKFLYLMKSNEVENEPERESLYSLEENSNQKISQVNFEENYDLKEEKILIQTEDKKIKNNQQIYKNQIKLNKDYRKHRNNRSSLLEMSPFKKIKSEKDSNINYTIKNKFGNPKTNNDQLDIKLNSEENQINPMDNEINNHNQIPKENLLKEKASMLNQDLGPNLNKNDNLKSKSLKQRRMEKKIIKFQGKNENVSNVASNTLIQIKENTLSNEINISNEDEFKDTQCFFNNIYKNLKII